MSDTKLFGDRKDFETTSWSLVRAARDVAALNTLISHYWRPLYFFVRQKGYDSETARDIVQEFFATFVEHDAIRRADPSRGRFRTFLLTSLANFVTDRARAAGRLKRGGGMAPLSLDFEQGEREYTLQVESGETPEHILDRAWARSLLDQALGELQGDRAHIRAFRLVLEGAPYKRICDETGLSEAAAKVAVHRLRERLRDDILARLRQTVHSDEDLEAEYAHFRALLLE